MNHPTADFSTSGTPLTRGQCAVCGTRMTVFGSTPAHEGLAKPQVTAKPKSSKATKSASNGSRSGKLVIVESPAKARTVSGFLGKGYSVRASVGHVRDLLKSELSVDVQNAFTPKYRVPNEKRPVVKEIKALAAKASEIYLATDPDREGEAIAWHLLESAEMDPQRTRRVVFHEVTKPAISEAFNTPRELDMDLVDAQQARRILDRLVGYSISPLLWQKVRRGLSAGRVQSVAVRMIVDREREIEAFVPVEYWSIEAELQQEGLAETYLAKLVKVDGQDPLLGKESDSQPIVRDLEKAAYRIAKLRKFEKKRSPFPPFTTSTLQQEASRRLGFSAKRTMALAQQLYEGVNVGDGGTTGLITYMRTDSTNLSAGAVEEARSYIANSFGKAYLPKQAIQYRTRSAAAQEAHEAIRPTVVMREPRRIKEFLTADQLKLYQLIWARFVACQMENAVYDATTVEVEARRTTAKTYLLRASGSTLKFKGWLEVYADKKDEDPKAEDQEDTKIPLGLEEGKAQKLIRVIPEQHFTQPPPRYTEASLVQALEEEGIGRPSTYAAILSTIQDRGYVRREARRLYPTEIGFTVNDLLVQYFQDIVDKQFTSRMENDLDGIASGETKWVDVVSRFYESFEPRLAAAREAMPEVKNEPEKLGRACPECGADLVIRHGRFGKFISCSTFPKCRYTEPWVEKIGVACPLDGGDLVERRTRRGRTFYGCANYPQCDFTSWKRPVAEPCPNCSGMMVISGRNQLECTKCGHKKEPADGDLVFEGG